MRPPAYTPYKVDVWTPGGDIEAEIGLVLDLHLAHALYHATVTAKPGKRVTLRQGARVISSSDRDG